jgi:hypothetical protein
MLEKLGVECSLQSKKIREKGKQTMLEKYNVEHALQNKDLLQQRNETNLELFGVENPLQCSLIKQKKDNTCEEKYGAKDIMHNPEIFEKVVKNSFKKKEFVLPSGKKITYQGYEDIAFNELLQSLNENDFTNDVKVMPKIIYDFDGKKKRYYPDIYLPSQNRFIEVKSEYTFKRCLSQNIAKQAQMFKDGYLFEFWICTTKLVIQKITKPITTETNTEEK